MSAELKKKRTRKADKKKQESRAIDPMFDRACTNIQYLKNGNLHAVQGCYRKKRLPNCP